MLDPVGRIITWSAGVENIEGYRPNEVIGKHFSCFFSPEDIALGQPELELHTAATQDRFESQGWRLRKDGSRYWAHVVLTALRDETGKLYGFTKILRDLTQQKQYEEQILCWNAELEQRVAQRTSQLEAANKELEAFSYSVSHDLRAPLRHIEGFIDMLQISAGSSLSQECQEFVKTISGSARRMNQLIDHLLAFSKMGRVEMFQNPVDMALIAEAVRIELSRGLEDRKIVWSIDALPTIQGDPVTIRQVLLNLVSNALKYTRPRGEARIEIGAEETPLETIFFVRDNGVGFDPQHAVRLFRVFQRLHTVGEFEGTGIGLAIVQRIVARHGGRTWAEACIEGGAVFYFTIPKSPVLSPPPDNPTPLSPTGDGSA
jgi:PAS domain S-box-containing protein